MRQLLLIVLLSIIACATVTAQSFWHFVPEKAINLPENQVRHVVPTRFKALDLEYSAMASTLRQAALEFSGGPGIQIELPGADGSMRRFNVWESPIVAPTLAAKYPETRTYAGHSADGYRVRLGTGPKGFHAYLFAPDGTEETIFPYADGETRWYMVYYNTDVPHPEGIPAGPLPCGVDPMEDMAIARESSAALHASPRNADPVKLKTYRMAIAAKGEYSTFHGGTKPLVHNAIVTALNYINAINERDLAVRFELIPNNDDLIFLDATTDPYTGSQTSGWMDQNPGAIDPIIGVNSYDIGQVFGVYISGNFAVGIAGGRACNDDNKGRACSTAPQPVGDYFNKVATHEMCHQLSGSHSWNNCTADAANQRAELATYEPGSGSTLMGYPGACLTNDVQSDNDPYYHLCNLLQVQSFIAQGTGNTCGTEALVANNPPSAYIPLANDFYIPISTPFELTGQGSDPDGDAITYCWEQWDLGPTNFPAELGEAPASGPLFRSFSPSTNPNRQIPRPAGLVGNNPGKTEVLPTVSRGLTFRLTVRDNHPGGGAFAWHEVKFRSTSDAGPFLVTAPNASTTWTQNEYQTVTWDVANTSKAPVNCKTVNIRLSTDGGFTFPITLASKVPNNGKYCVKVPEITTFLARIRVEAADNIFFDISNANFKIQVPAQPGFSLCTGKALDTLCLPATYTTTISTSAWQGFNQPVTLALNSSLSGATVSFSPNPVPAGSDAVMTITMPANQGEGNFDLKIKGDAGGATDSTVVALNVVSSNFAGLSAKAPLDGATGQDEAPVMRWNGVADANLYDIQLASNPSFDAGVIVASKADINTDSFKVPNLLGQGKVFYWRFRPKNECGTGDWVGPFVFSTGVKNCQTLVSTDVPKNITGNSVVTVESKINSTLNGTISDVNITRVQGFHSYFKDLEMHLIGPSGKDVLLFKDKCPGYAGAFNFGFDDSKSGLFGCPPPNNNTTYKPVEQLSGFTGLSMNGQWTLRVKDNVVSSGGQISGFDLQLCSNVSLDPPAIVNNNTLQVQPGTNKAIGSDLLKAEDPNNSADQLVFTLMTTPKWGRLERNWSGEMLPGAQFTQTDLNNGLIRYFDYGANTGTDQFCFAVTDGEGGLVKGCFTIQPFPVGTFEAQEAIDFVLSPNPATDAVRLAFSAPLRSEARVRLFDSAGRLLRQSVLAEGQWTLELPVRGLPQSIYTISVENAEGSGVRRVVVR